MVEEMRKTWKKRSIIFAYDLVQLRDLEVARFSNYYLFKNNRFFFRKNQLAPAVNVLPLNTSNTFNTNAFDSVQL